MKNISESGTNVFYRVLLFRWYFRW